MRARISRKHQELVIITIIIAIICCVNVFKKERTADSLIDQRHRITSISNDSSQNSDVNTTPSFTIEDMKKYENDIGCISRVNELIYVHVPKTGGTTIEKSSLFLDARQMNGMGIRKRPVGGHSPIGALKIHSKERGFIAAAHIRHPCERFISAFRYLTSTKCNKGDKRYADKHIGDMTIDEFVMDSHNKGWRGFGDWPHFEKQHLFLIDENQFGVDQILCQEQWNEGIERLYHSVGLEEVPSYLLSNKKSTEESSTKTTNSGHLLKIHHESCADLKPFTRQSLERYYAMDYCLFEYGQIPSREDGQCIGTTNTKEDFQVKFEACKKKMEEMNQKNDYASIHKYLKGWNKEEDVKQGENDRVKVE